MIDSRRAELKARTQQALDSFADVPRDGLGAYLRLQACMIALVELEDRCFNMDEDPYPPLLKMLSNIQALPLSFSQVYAHLNFDASANATPDDDHAGTRELFQTAWTTYDHKTYAHSLKLMQSRLECSGFDDEYFAGKRCIDSGCGTGRFAIAMALAGAKEVIAADFGDESLAFLEERKKEYNVPQVTPIKMDVTDMFAFETESFDFVASHGVLHHTPHPDRGIKEHFRITKPGGQLWLYLYGAGGIYWPLYDELRKLLLGIEPKHIRAIFQAFGLRKGLIYTFLDNFLAPRVYYGLEQTLDLLRPLHKFSFVHMKGTSPVDDTEKVLATKWGKELWGPDGEVRIVVTKDAIRDR
jgi:ubiquinone/menaquinone biosynthesis C-methylase UbiE